MNALAIRAKESRDIMVQYKENEQKQTLQSRLKKHGLLFRASWQWKSDTFSVLPAILIQVRKGDSSIVFGPKYIIEFYFLTMRFCLRSVVWGVAG